MYLELASLGGGGGIRTHGSASTTTVFETVPIVHSGTPPRSPVGGQSPCRELLPLKPWKNACIKRWASCSSTPQTTCTRWFSHGERTRS